jgi:hypothetical protein
MMVDIPLRALAGGTVYPILKENVFAIVEA